MSSDRDTENLETQIAIIGGGGGGLAAAVAAAEKGTKVTLLEKRRVTGGTSALAGGPFGAESPTQSRQGIIARRDDLFKRAMSWAHWKIDPRIVRAFIDKSGDTIRWLEEKGLRFECLPHCPYDMPLTWHVPKGRGRELIKVLAWECKKLGVEVLLRTQAKRILTGMKGNVTGVLAMKDGRECTITAKSVIIATGGYAGNKKLLKKYCPNYPDDMNLRGVPNTGDGLIMATEIGAATEGLGILMAGPGGGPPTMLNVGTEPNIIQVPLGAILREHFMIRVNKKGKRYVDEAIGDVTGGYEAVNAVLRQPDGLSYILFDTKMAQIVTEQGVTFAAASTQFGKAITGKLDGFEKGLQIKSKESSTANLFKISDSWDEIAEWMGAEPEVLRATIDEYNTACDHGYDPIFAKDRTYLLPLRTPPYYAIKCHMGCMNTVGGIKINENMEVLDKQDNPIPGLYAAGVDTGGWSSDTYCIVIPGTALGFALNSGRIAGENAVNYILVREMAK